MTAAREADVAATLAGGATPSTRGAHEDAVAAFARSYPELELAPVAVVIPAYNEADSLGGVLDRMPREACGLAVDTIVVDDGSADGTGEAALARGVYRARLGRNSGQGAALRVGYELARQGGARYVVTLDADGQWDPADIPSVLEPLVAGDADLVLGSRVLGRTHTDDAFRQVGVHVFSALVRLLTGTRVTDTSSGLRAMRAEVTGQVRQEEAQYQASELLVGAIAHGYRIAERPVVMRKRAVGASKKGHNLLYGVRYGRVLLKTWSRERRSRRRRAG